MRIPLKHLINNDFASGYEYCKQTQMLFHNNTKIDPEQIENTGTLYYLLPSKDESRTIPVAKMSLINSSKNFPNV